jgi:hypothetical protein
MLEAVEFGTKNAIFWDVTPCALLRNDVSEERIAFIINVTRIGEQGTTLVFTMTI